ncbi:MAG: 2-oxo acid dehydrogenase subunit E2 [Treponema sp.]|nr:2-oxo acid dehydrogenase subunit E2 [Treponema sp.]
MAYILIMPRQGNTVESCIIVDWKVKEGDSVTEETAVCEVETDKAAFEIPAGKAGTVLKILSESGDDVPVLSPIAVIGAAGENWQAALDKTTPEEAPLKVQKKEENKDEVPDNKGASIPDPAPYIPHSALNAAHSHASPRARSLAEKEALPLESVHGTGPEGRIIERDVSAALEKRPALTLAAKAAVRQHGTGFAGRITSDDISASHSLLSNEDKFTETPVKGIRRIISDKMSESLSGTAQFTLNAYAPVSRLQDIRSRMKTSQFLPDNIKSLKITVNDLIVYAVSRVLPLFSFMNAHKTGDTIKTFENVHMGVAVDTPRGLMVPVIRNANLLSLYQISSETKRLASSCQGGSVKPQELTGSTFTVTNLGAFGITGFTPILNVPEVAILGVCGIELKPAASEARGESGYSFTPHIGFSLTINHQAVDGAPAARFLKTLCEAVENIDLLLSEGSFHV